MVETPVDTRRDRPPEKKICFRFAKISPSATVQKLFSSTLFFSDFQNFLAGAGRFSISIYRPAGGRNRRAHTAESDPRKKVCFRFAKIFAFGDGVFLEVIF